MIVATAGHVDHGKTLLVRALTGTDTDRLPEEKRRGMTIDLGFAYLPLAPAANIGFVDVPGHERFIRNMLCGVSGIDFALLVVAADDGPMPQTREHLAILDLLEVSAGAIVVTKADRVPRDRLEQISDECTALVAPTALAGAPRFAVSAITGEGIAPLAAHLREAAAAIAPRPATGNFRLPIDRAFTLPGAGLVVTGTAAAGSIATGQTVRALLAGCEARVRSLHVHNARAERGRAGERCALNLAGPELRHAAIGRGDWIVAGDVPAAARRIDCRLRVLDSEPRPLAHWTPVHVHLGAADVTGRVALLEAAALAPGESALAQLVLDEPIGAAYGDRLIVRDQSARRTIGGGSVIDVHPPPRGRARPERLEALCATEQSDAGAALAALLEAGGRGVRLAPFAQNRNLGGAEAAALFAQVPMRRVDTALGALAFSPAHWARLRDAFLTALDAWHQRSPQASAIAEERVLDGTGVRIATEAIAAIAAELIAEGSIARSGTGVHLASRQPQLAPVDAELWRRVGPLLESNARMPPLVRDLAQACGEPIGAVEALLARAARIGLALRVAHNRFLAPAVARRLAEAAEALARESPGGRITAAQFRDRTGIGRNLAIEVLEFFDRVKFTRRAGDAHLLLRPASEAFPEERRQTKR